MHEQAKTLLILKVSRDVHLYETSLIEAEARQYGYDVVVHDVQHEDQLWATPEGPWSIVYVCGHGHREGVGQADGSMLLAWDDVASALCDHLGPEAWLFLACCRGGLREVVHTMLCACWSLEYVFGAPWKATPSELACAFHVLLHQFTHRQLEPARAADRAGEAIDRTIKSFDANEVRDSDRFLDWCEARGVDPMAGAAGESVDEPAGSLPQAATGAKLVPISSKRLWTTVDVGDHSDSVLPDQRPFPLTPAVNGGRAPRHS